MRGRRKVPRTWASRRALLARFERAAATHVTDHVEERLATRREPGFRARFAGYDLRPERRTQQVGAAEHDNNNVGAAARGRRALGPCEGKQMAPTKRTVNRSTTDRLKRIVETELAKQELTGEEIAREARLPSKAFRSLLQHGHRPTIDRADELCRALGITMTIGIEANPSGDDRRLEAATLA